MIRLLFVRAAAVVASLIFIATVAFGATDTKRPVGGLSSDGLRMNRTRILFDSGCTDSFNTPATTVNVNLTNLANWNSMATAVNPDRNINDATQTSGSADGWCDSAPWIIKGTTTSGNNTVYLGPFKSIPNAGFMLEWNFSAAAGNYQFFFCHKAAYDTSVCRTEGGNAAIATTGDLTAEISPFPPVSSQYSTFDNFWFVDRPTYMRITFASAGTYTFMLATTPVIPYYMQRGE